MGPAQEVLGPLVATHPEAPYLLALLKALDAGTLDARIDAISAVLLPRAEARGPIQAFL